LKIAIIGSRSLSATDSEIFENLPCSLSEITEIISGGARGIDKSVERFAKNHGLKMTVIKPNYLKYGKSAPIIRNRQIVESADYVLMFWDWRSAGTKNVLTLCIKTGKPFRTVRR